MKEQNIKIKYIIFNKDDFYIAKAVDTKTNNELIIYITKTDGLNPGDILLVSGEWKKHQKYGEYFNVDGYKQELYTDTASLRKFLITNIKGIGPARADNLINTFGDSLEEVFNNSPEKIGILLNIKNMDPVIKSWQKATITNKLQFDLAKIGISGKLLLKVIDKYKEKSLEIVKNNPYILTYELDGVGFKTADNIASKVGLNNNNPKRIASGLIYYLKEYTSLGNSCIEKNTFIYKVSEELSVSSDEIKNILEDLITKKILFEFNDYVYTKHLLKSEQNIAKRLIELNKRKVKAEKKSISKYMYLLPNETGVAYTAEQESIISMSAYNPVLIITGGPGTGKTTTIKGIVKLHQKLGRNIYIAAPTGRAAKRINESMNDIGNVEAMTIHRLLEFKSNGKGGWNFEINKENTLGDLKEEKTVIIDESSMIDVYLMSALLDALDNNTSLILVGDMDQLPSVGPGCVFKNIIDSNIFYTGHLSQIQRQAEDSDIIYLSSVIKNKSGRLSVRNNPSDVSLINLKDKNAEDLILDIYTKELKMNDIMDVQILLPQRTTVLGVNEINKKIRDIVNKNSESLPSTFGDFKVNDKVMQMKNNYELEVFNGDIGQIIKYDADEKAILVKFSDREVYYDEIYAEQLTLCYATTVHKSQGSEYKSVIFMVHKSHTYMLEKNLIYTAITRAKNKLYFLYDARTLYISQNKNNAFNRNTNLPIFLKEAQKEILRK